LASRHKGRKVTPPLLRNHPPVEKQDMSRDSDIRKISVVVTAHVPREMHVSEWRDQVRNSVGALLHPASRHPVKVTRAAGGR
jgi:hypothetical protein